MTFKKLSRGPVAEATSFASHRCAGVPSSSLGYSTGFEVDETEFGYDFLGVFPIYPYHKY